MAFLKHVRANRIRGEWRLTKITRHMAKLCRELGIELGDDKASGLPKMNGTN
jgi:hypothetical protein